MNYEINTRNIRTICCSFCKKQGHCIKNCDNEKIKNLEINIIDFIDNVIPLRINLNISPLQNLKDHLANIALLDANLIKSFAICRCEADTKSNVIDCIEQIIYYFNERLLVATQRDINNIQNGYDCEYCIYDKLNIKTKKINDDEGVSECYVCYNEYKKSNFVKLNCGHNFCYFCVKQFLQNKINKEPCCALCRIKINELEIRDENVKTLFDNILTNDLLS